MPNRFRDWHRQAEADLRHARHALEDGDFDWGCFAAQQAAEKAIKAVFLKHGMDAWGHTTTTLLGQLGTVADVPDELINAAKRLDKHYIPTRYPNGFESGAPVDFYTREETERAIQDAETVLEFCANQID